MRVLVTGGAGFIGSAVVRRLLQAPDVDVLNVDTLTYAGNLDSVADVASHPRYRFAQADVSDLARMRSLFADFRPSAVLHLAAESHVDRSIDGPAVFMRTNVLGTFTLLDVAHLYWKALPAAAAERFRFVHVSTDEVFGSLGDEGAFTEETAYRPSSPYAASKAAADHLATAWVRTYGLPVIVTNCSNNYGPRQFPEKLIPLVLLAGLAGKPVPVYGTGQNVRDWLFVDDHAEALFQVLTRGRAGATYVIGGGAERRNLDVARDVCRLLDELAPDPDLAPRERLITFVEDRPGHDHRYAIDARKIRAELGWAPREDFASGLRKTVRWYLDHRPWWERVLSGAYRGERLGLGGVR